MHLVKYILSICFNWPPGCHSFKIRGTIWWKPISIEWHRRIEHVKFFLCVNRNTANLVFWAVARYVYKFGLFPLNVDRCSLIGYTVPFQSIWLSHVMVDFFYCGFNSFLIFQIFRDFSKSQKSQVGVELIEMVQYRDKIHGVFNSLSIKIIFNPECIWNQKRVYFVSWQIWLLFPMP